MANGINLQGIGLGLQGLGAGIQGRLPEFQQAQAQRQQSQAKQQQQGQEQQLLQQLGALQPGQVGQSQLLQQLAATNPQLATSFGQTSEQIGIKREIAQATDAQKGRVLLEQGKTQEFLELADNRINDILTLGGDPTQSQNIRQDVLDGDIEGATALLRVVEQTAIAGGLIKPIDKARKFLKTEKGRATFLNPDGTVSEEAVQGALTDAGETEIKVADFRNINKDVGALIKEPVKIRNAAARLDKISETKSPTDQLAAIFTFMKTLDPTSVVREGEQQAARETGGVTDQFIGFINQIQGEGALPPEVFDNMVATAKRLANQAATDSGTEVSGFLDAFGDRLDPEDKERLLGRLPQTFELPGTGATPTTVGRFTVETSQ